MTQRNSMFVLLGVFIALLGLVAWQTSRTSTPLVPTPIKDVQDTPNRLFTWRTEEMQAFSIRDPYTGATLSFQRDNSGQWQFLEMPDAIPDQQGVDRMALTVSILPYRELLDKVKAADYPTFGLTQTNAFLIVIALLKNGEQHTIIIGDVAPGGAAHYALVDDRAGVYTIDARPVAFLVSMLKQVYEPTPVPTQEATAAATP